jgi:hypothetical protein
MVDLLATITAAGLVITDSPETLALATGLARPALGIADEDAEAGSPPAWANKDVMVARLDELLVLAPMATAESDLDRRLEEVASRLDLFFDDFASALLAAGASQLSHTASQRFAELSEQVWTLEVVNAGLQERLFRERMAMAGYVWAERHTDQPISNTGVQVSPSERALWGLHPNQAEIQRLQKEIEAIYATKTMRVVQPARRLYARLRTRLS